MQESVFVSGFRTFVTAFCKIFGVLLGILLAISAFSLFESKGSEIESEYSLEVAPNAKNVRTALSSTAPVILVLPIDGVIGGEGLNAKMIRQQLIESREGTLHNNRVKAIFLEINTPGGGVLDADAIYRALKAYKKEYNVPVYAYVDGLCASGGMYVASAADKIYASDVSLIGSVGVVTPSRLNLSQLLDKIGVQPLTLSAGKGKDELNPLRPWKPGEEDKMQGLVNFYYQRFVDVVTANRPQLSKEKLVDEYGAAVYPANEAFAKGYVDGSGFSRGEALTALLKLIGIEDDFYQVVKFQGKSWFSQIFNEKNALTFGSIQLKLPQELDIKFSNQPLYLYQPGAQ
ncbi:S49 family peptidase [Parachlamydia sp. AcF125]|uniref:S49 family peptidase n=1 Tax=Parachlamydia sp. AcF125 TaxID=2795736 RepID=UPI001BC8F3B9|nr:S49 family peptidase [Parachlamydia sp. AcF125]MBS4168235.1 putative signal peptide peptidase SppA [Parachlamydia sp. AcF125]